MSEINKVAGSFRSSESKAVSTAKPTLGRRNMLTYLRETTRASEYANSPSKSFVFNGYSIKEGEYFVSRNFFGNLTASRKLPRPFKNMPLFLERVIKFA